MFYHENANTFIKMSLLPRIMFLIQEKCPSTNLKKIKKHQSHYLKQRQAEGIRIAKEKGVRFGSPNKLLPSNTNEILDKYINHEINNIEAAKLIGVSRGTFFRLVKAKKTSNR